MSEIDVRIVTLQPTRVASTYGFGGGPEKIAWKKMIDFVKSKGLDRDGQVHRYLGFNNPNPAPGSPNYGYEQWVTVEPGTLGSNLVTVKPFSGGRYAVMDCMGLPMPDKWAKLVQWVQDGPYEMEIRPCLEECLTPEYLFEPASMPDQVDEALHFLLYLPIRE